MPKLKTHKSTSKRFRVTKNGKIEKRTCGQAHFNAHESGNTRRNKRSDIIMGSTVKRIIQITLPN